MAIILDEPAAQACMVALRDADEIVISAGTLAECFIVASRRRKTAEMEELIDGLAPRIEPVSSAVARRVADAYGRWGRGVHSTGLSFGDCFAYAEAARLACPLLFVGNDFGQTDIMAV